MLQPHVLCIGSAGRDIFFPTDAGTLSDQKSDYGIEQCWSFGYGEKIHVDDRFQALGGCACNVSVGLARLGITATAWGMVGTDADGAWVKEELLRENVDVEHLYARDGMRSDLSVILVHTHHGDRVIFANRDAGEHLTLRAKEVGWYKWVFVGSLYGDQCGDNMRILHDIAKSQKTSVIYNPGMSNIIHHTRLVYDLLHHSSIIFVNKKEAREIIKRGGIIDEATVMKMSECELVATIAEHASNRATVILTFGSAGAWVWQKGAIIHAAAQAQKIVDTTGAGDAFASGFVAAILLGKDVVQAVQWGSANSHNVITAYGAQQGLLHTADITGQIADFSVKEVV